MALHVVVSNHIFSIMPPSFPHAVSTISNCFAVGGHFYTSETFYKSLEGLKAQEDHGELSNEDLYGPIYEEITAILEKSNVFTGPEQRARIASACHIFSAPHYDEVRGTDLRTLMKRYRLPHGKNPRKHDMVEMLERNGIQLEFNSIYTPI